MYKWKHKFSKAPYMPITNATSKQCIHSLESKPFGYTEDEGSE